MGYNETLCRERFLHLRQEIALAETPTGVNVQDKALRRTATASFRHFGCKEIDKKKCVGSAAQKVVLSDRINGRARIVFHEKAQNAAHFVAL